MTRYRALAILAVAASLAAAPTRPRAAEAGDAPCAGRIDRIMVRGAATYAPFALATAELPIEIELKDVGTCRLSVTFDSAGGNRLAGADDHLQYQLRGDAGHVIETDGARPQPVAPLSGRQGIGFRAGVSVPGGQAVRPGSYHDRLSVQLLDADQVIDERQVELTVNVQPQASISMTGNGASGFSRAHGARLDFGHLSSGKERELFLFVLSNTAYALQFSSENHGTLRQVSDGPAGETIGYTARLDGQVLDLSGTETVDGRSRHGALVLPPYRLNARIGNVEGKPAGQYRDVITVDVLILE